MFSESRIIHDPEIETALRKRYSAAISELEDAGCTYVGALENEHHLPLLPIAVCFGLVGRETRRWKSPFRVSWYHAIMRSSDGTTLAYPFGIGTRLYTFFEDGSAHRTTASIDQNQESTTYSKRSKLFVANVNAHETTVSETFERHLGFVEQYRTGGKTPTQSAEDKLVTMQIDEDSFFALASAAFVGWGFPIGCYFLALQKIFAA